MTTLQEHQILLDLLEKSMRNKVRWLKKQKDANYALFNAGQIHAYNDVLRLIESEVESVPQ